MYSTEASERGIISWGGGLPVIYCKSDQPALFTAFSDNVVSERIIKIQN